MCGGGVDINQEAGNMARGPGALGADGGAKRYIIRGETTRALSGAI